MAKKGRRGVRYTAAQRAIVLAAAKKAGLTGDQVAKKFGISKLTFYRWRGPVRSDAVARRGGRRGHGRPKGSVSGSVNVATIREKVRAQLRKLLPQIIREELDAVLGR